LGLVNFGVGCLRGCQVSPNSRRCLRDVHGTDRCSGTHVTFSGGGGGGCGGASSITISFSSLYPSLLISTSLSESCALTAVAAAFSSLSSPDDSSSDSPDDSDDSDDVDDDDDSDSSSSEGEEVTAGGFLCMRLLSSRTASFGGMLLLHPSQKNPHDCRSTGVLQCLHLNTVLRTTGVVVFGAVVVFVSSGCCCGGGGGSSFWRFGGGCPFAFKASNATDGARFLTNATDRSGTLERRSFALAVTTIFGALLAASFPPVMLQYENESVCVHGGDRSECTTHLPGSRSQW